MLRGNETKKKEESTRKQDTESHRFEGSRYVLVLGNKHFDVLAEKRIEWGRGVNPGPEHLMVLSMQFTLHL